MVRSSRLPSKRRLPLADGLALNSVSSRTWASAAGAEAEISKRQRSRTEPDLRVAYELIRNGIAGTGDVIGAFDDSDGGVIAALTDIEADDPAGRGWRRCIRKNHFDAVLFEGLPHGGQAR